MTVRRRRPTPRRRKAPRWTKDQWATASPRLLRRAGFRCERCGTRVTEESCERHHRQRRDRGGDRYANLLILCRVCHPWVHAHPDIARGEGWIVSAASEVDPADVPVRRSDGYLWLLDDGGSAAPLL